MCAQRPRRWVRAILYAIERERLEQKFRRLNEELEQRIRERTAELEATNKELEAFSYSVSHDLRGPLTTLHGFADLLLEKYGLELGEKPRNYLHKINEAATRMACLIDDLLKLAKVNSQELSLCDVSIKALVEEVLRGLEGETVNRKIEWRIGILPSIQCDPGLMRQVMTNLISNAIKYTRPRDPAVIEVRDEIIDGESTFLVRDNGVGFDLNSAEKLFSPFHRFHRSEEFEGTGIGLATVQRILQKHKGRIWAHSAPQQGSTFYFTVGVKQEDLATVARV